MDHYVLLQQWLLAAEWLLLRVRHQLLLGRRLAAGAYLELRPLHRSVNTVVGTITSVASEELGVPHPIRYAGLPHLWNHPLPLVLEAPSPP